MDATALFKSEQQKILQNAMRELGKFYGLKDNNTFMQILLAGAMGGKLDVESPTTAGIQEDEQRINTALEKIANAIISLRGDGLFTDELIKIFQDYTEGDDPDELADYLKSTPKDSNKVPIISFTSPNTSGSQTGFLRAVSVADVLETTFPPVGTGKGSVISIIEVHHPNLNFSNRDTMSSAIFLQALPSIEISKAVPYFDIKTIVKDAPVSDMDASDQTTFLNGVSIYKFLNGDRITENDTVLKTLVSAKPVSFDEGTPALSGGAGNQTPPVKTSTNISGMELFTSPQTMVDGTLQYQDLDATSSNYGPDATPTRVPQGQKVLDKFRPLMTFKSMSVQVTPATGMLATKAADVSLVLHDKTRMNQIGPLITPSSIGDVEFQIEWGWSHPESDPLINPYGALINSMRCKEKYGIMNSSYSFTATGEVEISLKLYTKGATNATFELISNSESKTDHPTDVLKKLVSSIRNAMKDLKSQGYTLNEEMGAPDVLGKASSAKGLYSLDKEQRKQITNFINSMKKRSSATGAAFGQLASAWDTAQEDVKSLQDEILDHFNKIIDKCTKKGKDTTDPYILDMQKKLGKKELFNIGGDTHVSLAKVLLHFVAEPIRATGKFDEIQMLFYPMNEFAMFARDLNVGQYPINKDDLKDLLIAELKKSPSISIQKFLNTVKRLFLNFVGDDIYGLSKFYAKNKESGKRELQEVYKNDENKKQEYAAEKVQVLNLCYGDGEKRFKKPNVQMFVECVAHEQDATKTILRLHFFDRATTSYSSYAQLWQASSSSDLGVVGKYVGAKRSHAKAVKSPPPKGSKNKDKKKWEELCASRNKRVTDYKPLMDSQKQQFEKTGLLESFKVIKTDDKGNKNEVERFRIAGGPDQLRGILAANMPTLKYGTEYSGILSADLSTMSNPMMETIHMQRQGKSSGPVGAIDNGLPMQIKPVELSLETFGCPFINFGQQFFVDFQTNTTIDDVYAVSGVSHSISPGEFKSSIKLTPLNKLGQFRSMVDAFDDAAAIAKEEQEKEEK